MSPWRVVTYSASMVALSTLGTGYFIGLFNPYASQAFGISQSTLSLIFSVSTIAAVIPMFFFGRLIDDFSLRSYTIVLLLGFACACVLLGWSSTLAAYATGVFFIRLIGDWLFAHAALTTSARRFGGHRTRLSGLTALGYAIGPAVIPAAALAIASDHGWRTTWYVIAAFMIGLVVPAMLLLLAPGQERAAAISSPITIPKPGLSLVLDRRILAFLPAVMTTPLVFSGLLFHQSVWTASRGGSPEWLSLGLMAYAISQATAMLSAGLLAEKFALSNLISLHALPAALGLMFGIAFDGPWTIVVYLAGAGFTTGFALTLIPLLLIAIYGSQRLGSSRAMTQSFTLLCTASSTTALGFWIDAGGAIEPALIGGVGYIALSSILVATAGRIELTEAISVPDASNHTKTDVKA